MVSQSQLKNTLFLHGFYKREMVFGHSYKCPILGIVMRDKIVTKKHSYHILPCIFFIFFITINDNKKYLPNYLFTR